MWWQKDVSTTLGIIIILLTSVIIFGGVFVYEAYFLPEIPPIVESQRFVVKTDFLTLEQFKNASYDISSEGLYFSTGMFGPKEENYNPASLKLTNGSYNYGPEHITYPSQCTSDVTHSVSILKDSNGQPMVAFGDLDGDGQGDAVVMLNLTYEEKHKGGPHDFCLTNDNIPIYKLMLVVFLNKNGLPLQVDQYMGRNGATGGFNDSDISSMKIQNGTIDLVKKTTEDHYKLVGGKLVKAGQVFVAQNIPSEWKTYTNNSLGISFMYPSDVTLDNPQLGGIKLSNGIYISVSNDDFGTCVNKLDEPHGIPAEIMINNTPFYEISGGDAAMGTYGNAVQYSAVKNGICYQAGVFYFTHNCSAYLPLEQMNAQQKENYNKCLVNNTSAQALPGVLDKIISTLKFNK